MAGLDEVTGEAMGTTIHTIGGIDGKERPFVPATEYFVPAIEYVEPTEKQIERRAESFRALASQMKGYGDVMEVYAEAYEAMRAYRDFWKRLFLEGLRREQ